MCGIAGLITKRQLDPRDLQQVSAINALLIHRGPDGQGEYHDSHVALAMRRLSIIDLNSGWQPLYNEDRSLVLICNGEVYNFIELRKQLEAKGHRYATGSDCENILHLYEEHGERCVDHLRGMYAFALWDTRRKKLLLGRDRMGEKPLYLVERDGEILFASELKALVRSGAVPFELDHKAVHMYMHYRYVPEPATAVRGVRKLPAGHTLSISLEPWTVEERCYWRMEDSPPIQGNPAAIIRDELDRISELIIRSDVPVGVALSGGMDSSAIATLAAKHYPGTMHAFSIGYAGRPLQDERRDARALADHIKMPFHDIEITTDDVVREFPEMTFSRDDPIADIGGQSYYTVMRLARSHNVPVMLMGHGGDELFWGYAWVRHAARASRRKMALHNGSGASLKDYLQITRPPYSYTGAMRWMKSLGGLRSGWRRYHADRQAPLQRMVFYDEEHHFETAAQRVASVYADKFIQRLNGADPTALFTLPLPWPDVDVAITRLICESYLFENGIAQGDRLGMASSVELRLPLVDYKLVETVIGLRKAHSDLNQQPKAWLREAVKDIMPPFVMQRRKRGFTPPWREWNTALSRAYGDTLIGGYLVQHGVLAPAAAHFLRDELTPARFGASSSLAECCLVLETWCRGMAGSVVTPATGSYNSARS